MGRSRTYRILLRLFPADFRAEYGNDMVQLFSDQVRDEGLGRSWLTAMGDIPRSAASEHLRRNRTVAHAMTVAPSPISRLLGLLGVIGGGFLLIGFLGLTIAPDLFNLRLVVFNLGAIAIAFAMYRRQANAGRWLALAGSIPAIVANALYLAFILRLVAQPGELGPGDYQPINLFALTAAAMWLSDAWLGVVTLRLGVMNRWSALALVVGSVAALLGMGDLGLASRGSPAETIILAGVALQGLAWILLGLELAFRRHPMQVGAA